MAAVTAANVTILKAWDEGSKAGQLIQAVRQVAVVLSTQGGTIADMPAALFQLADISEVYSYGINNGGTWSEQAVILDNSQPGIGVLTTAPSTGAIANASGTLYMTVKGRPL